VTQAPPAAGSTAAPPDRPPRLSRRTREAIAAYGFLSPWIAGMVLLTLGPMVYSLYLSFTRYNLMTRRSGWVSTTTCGWSPPIRGSWRRPA
jgi:hypothetical protein